MASLENSAIELDKNNVEIHELCLNTIRSFDLILKDKDGELNTNFEANPSIIIGDSFHIGNVLFNLLDNAIKYSAENPKIDLHSYSDKKGIYLEIRDQGIGISDKDKKQIFDKFYRVTKGDLHDVKGYGLGLNYAKTMVHLHKGWIKLKNNIPNGSIFTIFLPFKQ
jgi:signal transduction histidine kinase